MTAPLMMSVSGIRGIVGETMTPELILKAGSALARSVKSGTVVIGRDSRPTGEAISRAMQATLAMCGCDVVDIGIVPTPTVQVMVEELKAAGGIVISASHNPIQWNAFKIINKSGTFFNSREIDKLFALMKEPLTYKKWDKVGTLTSNTDSNDVHNKKILSVIDVKAIKKKKFRVVLDSVNGAGSIITQELLRELGCTVFPIHCTPDGRFPRGAEPVPANLSDLSRAVVRHNADIGFAQDPDADRLAIVDEKGQPLGEEYTIVLVADHLLSQKAGRVVVNLSTTKAVEDIAQKYRAPFARARVGEINVVDEMRKKGARIGGEGNGGVISPEIHLGRDSLAGIGYVLDMMAHRNRTVSQLKSDMPDYTIKKGKVSYNPDTFNAGILDELKNEFRQEKLSSIDGLRIDFKNHTKFKGGWVHLRPSNTEPIFRIITEGTTSRQANAIYSYFTRLF